MSIVYNSDNFLDRVRETEEIVTFITQECSKNKVLCVCGNTGVGKTALIKKALTQKQITNKEIIIAETPPVNQNECVVQGEYLRIIANKVNRCLCNIGYSMQDFFRSASDYRTRSKELQIFCDTEFSKLPRAVLSNIVNRYYMTGSYDTERALYDTDVEATLIKKEYLRFVFENVPVILYVSNFHNIDSSSLSILSDIIVNANSLSSIFVFEYTCKNDDISDIYKYQTIWADRCETAIQFVDMLPINVAASIGGERINLSFNEWCNFYKDIIKGNLYKVLASKHQEQSNFEHDPLDGIRELGLSETVILQIVLLHGGEISVERLCYLLNENAPDILTLFLNRRGTLELYLTFDIEYIKIAHASISDYLSKSSAPNIIKAGYIAYGIIRSVLSRDLAQKRFTYYCEKDIVLLLIKVFVGYDTEKLIAILGQFKRVVIDEISIEQIYYLLEQVTESLRKHFDKQTVLSLIKILYDIGLYEKAYETLCDNYFPSLDMYMYKAILLNRQDMHEDCINFCREIKKKEAEPRFQFVIQLVEMLSLKTLKKTDECTKLYFKLLNTQNYKQLPEYGILLRNSEIVMSRKDDIPYIQRSIALFKGLGDQKNVVYSTLTLATEIAYSGEVTYARNCLNKIKQFFLETTTEKHIILNDLAALDLIERKATKQTILLFNQSLLTSRNPYDTLTIYNNIICCFLVREIEFNNMAALLRKIDLVMNLEPDKRIHRRLFFNLHQYYRYICRDCSAAEDFWKKMQSIHGTVDEHLDELIRLENRHSLSLFPFYPSFITYWHFDIPMIELNY